MTALRGPPLSNEKMIGVFSLKLRLSRAATILPTWSSSEVIIAASVRRVGSLIVAAQRCSSLFSKYLTSPIRLPLK